MLMMDNNIIKITNVRIIDKNTDKIGSVTIENGLITDKSFDSYDTIIDGKGKVLMPAFADLHAHFRDPGFIYKEDLETGSKAAVKGGYTTVVLMPNTNPVCSSMQVYKDVKNRIKEIGLIDCEPVIAISDELKGQTCKHLESIGEEVRFLSDDGKGVMNSRMMEHVLELSKNKNLVIMSHAEDSSFSSFDMRKAENYMTLRDVYACEQTGGRLHLCHVSTKEAMQMIIDAKNKGVNVTCEVTPHHLFFINEKPSDLSKNGCFVVSNYRVNPPIRKIDDVEFLIQAIKDGFVDAIATDHAPHSQEDKEKGSPGISGIETSFQACLTRLVKENAISLSKLSELMSYNPCKIIGINKGLIDCGYNADLVLVDVDKKIKIDVNNFISKSKNSPIDKCEVYGEILMTIKNGKIVYNNIEQ